MRSEELYALVQHLNGLYELYAQDGIPRGAAHYVRTDTHLDGLLQVDDRELARVLEVKSGVGADVVIRLLDWFKEAENREEVVARLETLGPDTLCKLNVLVGIGNLKKVLAIWQDNQNNDSEEFWQRTLSGYSFGLSQIFSFPVIILREKAYVGGKGIENVGGNLVDFLVANGLTRNTALIEIKTPEAPLVGSPYRGVYTPSSDLGGAITQVLNYRDSLLKEFNELQRRSRVQFEAFDPQCLVIAGCLENFRQGTEQKKSFELFRSGLKDVRVITYDELFAKVQVLVQLLECDPTRNEMEDDLPF